MFVTNVTIKITAIFALLETYPIKKIDRKFTFSTVPTPVKFLFDDLQFRNTTDDACVALDGRVNQD